MNSNVQSPSVNFRKCTKAAFWCLVAVALIAVLVEFGSLSSWSTPGRDNRMEIVSSLAVEKIIGCLERAHRSQKIEERLTYIAMGNSLAVSPGLNGATMISQDRMVRLDLMLRHGRTVAEITFSDSVPSSRLSVIRTCLEAKRSR